MDAKHQLSFRCNEVEQVGSSLFFFFSSSCSFVPCCCLFSLLCFLLCPPLTHPFYLPSFVIVMFFGVCLEEKKIYYLFLFRQNNFLKISLGSGRRLAEKRKGLLESGFTLAGCRAGGSEHAG